MRLKAVVLKNFRCYREEVRIPVAALTALIGRNDIGKSTVLEALEIFFNNRLVKMEPSDAALDGDDTDVRIGCVFEGLPDPVVLDATAETSLASEFLLNGDGDLEIHKVFDCTLKTPKDRVVAVAVHPTREGANDLLELKQTELRARMRSLDVPQEEVDLRRNPEMRRAIWSHITGLEPSARELPLDKQDAKKIWAAVATQLPVFALFQADRPSLDEDSEVQDPMKLAVSEALRSVSEQLEEIKTFVQERTIEVAQKTVEKLREMDETLADDLIPEFKAEPKWDGIFKLTLRGANGIPVNKRGSGVRRLILLNFFRAEAERLVAERSAPSVVYGIEEPETSQHPDKQLALLDALLQLSAQDRRQVLLTTHVPGLAAHLPADCIRYITDGEDRARVVRSAADDPGILEEVSKALGVVPDNRVRALVCVEGPTDVRYLRALSSLLHQRDPMVPDLSSDERFAFVVMGGSTLGEWVNERYLKGLGRPECHMYDRDGEDPPRHQEHADEVNVRGDGSFAHITAKREIENYLHPDAIAETIGVAVGFGDDESVPEAVAEAVHEASEAERGWTELDDFVRGRKKSRAKRRLSLETVDAMTLERLQERDPDGEIEGWLRSASRVAAR